MLTFGSGLDLYTSSDYLPRALYDSVKGPSYAVDETAWQDAVGTKKPRWDWLEEPTSLSALLDGRNAEGSQKSGYPGIFGSNLRDAVQQAATDGKYTQLRRPEHSTFSLAMVGGGRVFGRAHLHGMLSNLIFFTEHQLINATCRLSLGVSW